VFFGVKRHEKHGDHKRGQRCDEGCVSEGFGELERENWKDPGLFLRVKLLMCLQQGE